MNQNRLHLNSFQCLESLIRRGFFPSVHSKQRPLQLITDTSSVQYLSQLWFIVPSSQHCYFLFSGKSCLFVKSLHLWVFKSLGFLFCSQEKAEPKSRNLVLLYVTRIDLTWPNCMCDWARCKFIFTMYIVHIRWFKIISPSDILACSLASVIIASSKSMVLLVLLFFGDFTWILPIFHNFAQFLGLWNKGAAGAGVKNIFCYLLF